ncbi:MAG: hemerythrin domain-containing protein [Chloroflexi bacterium]|nr:hemerythrin domain-containing protein [Chloroflexota bacterium]
MEVAEALALIDKIIEEHRIILGDIRDFTQDTNDVVAMRGLDQTREDFVPGRLEDQKQSLGNWQESLLAVDRGIQAHFHREETALVDAVAEYGDNDLASVLRHWLAEHKELRERLGRMKQDVAGLVIDTSAQSVWQEKAWSIRVYMTHTGKLFDVHARGEQEMMLKLRNLLGAKVENTS